MNNTLAAASAEEEKKGISTLKGAVEYFLGFFNELDFVAILNKIIAFLEEKIGAAK